MSFNIDNIDAMHYTIKALRQLTTGVGFNIKFSGGKFDYDNIVFDEENAKPSEQDLLSLIETLYEQDIAASDATRYKRDRAAAYPSIGDQLDALFHAGVFPAEMAARLQEVKNKYPKPTE